MNLIDNAGKIANGGWNMEDGIGRNNASSRTQRLQLKIKILVTTSILIDVNRIVAEKIVCFRLIEEKFHSMQNGKILRSLNKKGQIF
jgi:hypothetical protein